MGTRIAPPLTKYRDSCNQILGWHGKLNCERDDLIGEGITNTGSILIDEVWDPEVDNKGL